MLCSIFIKQLRILKVSSDITTCPFSIGGVPLRNLIIFWPVSQSIEAEIKKIRKKFCFYIESLSRSPWLLVGRSSTYVRTDGRTDGRAVIKSLQ